MTGQEWYKQIEKLASNAWIQILVFILAMGLMALAWLLAGEGE